MWADVHCHLYNYDNIEDIIERAKKANVTKMFSASEGFASSVENRNISTKFNSVFFLAGVSPQRASAETEDEIKPILEMMKKHGPKGVGFGEIGLDYTITKTDKSKWYQKEIFRHFLAYSEALNNTVVIHSRGAVSEVLEILNKYDLDRVLLHWFDGTKEELNKAIKKKYYISAGPKLLFSNKMKELVMNTPNNRLVLETDGPVKFSGKPSEPSWIPQIGEKVAQILGQNVAEVEALTYENSLRLFNLEKVGN